MIYFDNNATTMMSQAAIQQLGFWCNRGNPSAGYATAKAARAMMEELKIVTGAMCGVETCCAEPRDGGERAVDAGQYKVILNSGASEANSTIIRGVVQAYRFHKKRLPHVISSQIEHRSILDLLIDMEARSEISLTLIPPTHTGHIPVALIQNQILENTCLVTVMHANNETGAINDIGRIAAICHDSNIVFHSDCVQSFGKIPFDANSVDAFSISYHKLGGPPGVGALCVRQALLLGYDLPALICGTQNEGYRGGTENLPGMGASLAALKVKRKPTLGMKTYIMTELKARGLPWCLYKEYHGRQSPPPYELVFLSNDTEYYLPNTILIALVKRKGTPVCNVEMKNALEKKGIIVSVGSACNTSSSKASHVLDKMGADMFIKKGTLRISLSGDNTPAECRTFIKEYLAVCVAQLKT